jgi:hypothetical protein
MAKLIYDYWFVQFDFPDANGKPYKSSGGKMVYNEALIFLKEAKRQNEASIDAVAKVLSRFDEYNKYRNFKAFHFN